MCTIEACSDELAAAAIRVSGDSGRKCRCYDSMGASMGPTTSLSEKSRAQVRVKELAQLAVCVNLELAQSSDLVMYDVSGGIEPLAGQVRFVRHIIRIVGHQASSPYPGQPAENKGPTRPRRR